MPRNLRRAVSWSGTLLFAGLAGCSQTATPAPPVNTPAAAVAAPNTALGGPGKAPSAPAPAARPPSRYGFKVVNTYPHDAKAFSQGLVFADGGLYESTGQYGQSTLRRVELKTGRVQKRVALSSNVFGEGLTLLKGKLYQISWQNGQGFIYDAATLKQTGTFRYEGEGWGLATDGKSLILSDGTSRIKFLDPQSFAVTRTIEVTLEGTPLDQLNELEYIGGEIYANVWHTDNIVRIDPQTGEVRGVIELTGLLPESQRSEAEAVLNGIAQDAATGRLFVTGKLWPKLFEIKLVKQ